MPKYLAAFVSDIPYLCIRSIRSVGARQTTTLFGPPFGPSATLLDHWMERQGIKDTRTQISEVVWQSYRPSLPEERMHSASFAPSVAIVEGIRLKIALCLGSKGRTSLFFVLKALPPAVSRTSCEASTFGCSCCCTCVVCDF